LEATQDESFYDPNDYDFIRNKVFAPDYIPKFEELCKHYGKMLSQQSDRNKPRTHFNSHYTRMTRKNGHEMNGLLIVYLIVLVSSEKHIIDSKMGAGRASAFVHILEVSLMLSQFTKEKEHTRSDLRII